MKSLKLFGLAVLLAIASSAFMGAGVASATELYKLTASGSDTLGPGTEVTMSLKAGTSLLVKEDEFGTTVTTCTGSEIKGKTENNGSTVTLPISGLGFFPCSDSMSVLKAGKLHITWTSGTNGSVSWSEAELQLTSTVFGVKVTCKTGTGTTLGTLTGAKSSTEHATLDLNAKINCGILGNTTWTGTYTVTNPTGLVTEDSVLNTELYRTTEPASDKLGTGTELAMSLKSGTSLLVKEVEAGTTLTTCTGSEIKGKTEAPSATVTMPVSTLSFSSCSHFPKVLKAGKLHITWTSGTNGSVSWSDAEMSILSTTFGINVTCKTATGAGTAIGTVTGAKTGSEHATLDINATINCGIIGNTTWTGTYTITNPTGFAVEGSAKETEIYKITGSSTSDKLAAGTEIGMSLQSGGSLLLKDSGGNTATTCTGSEIKGKTEDGGATITIPATTLTYSGCTDTFDVLKAGKLHILWSSGTNGTVTWSEGEVTVKSTAFGISAVCSTGTGVSIGTLTGVKGGSEQATLDLAAKLPCGAIGTSELTGTYTVTTPKGLGVEEN